MKKKPYKGIFIVEAIPYKHDILICVGMTNEQVKIFLKKNKYHKQLISFIDAIKNDFDSVVRGERSGMSFLGKEKHTEFIVVNLESRDSDWRYWETLLHELSHVIDWIVAAKMLESETEARAYLHEYLFRKIRRKIQRAE